MIRRYSLSLPPFVGFAHGKDLDGHRIHHGVLRVGHHTNVVWQCSHLHHERRAAITCAMHARGQAVAAGLLPPHELAAW